MKRHRSTQPGSRCASRVLPGAVAALLVAAAALGLSAYLHGTTLRGQAAGPDGTTATYVTRFAAMDATPEWVLDSIPNVTIGLDDGPEEYLFAEIGGGRFLPDGRVAIADGRYRTIRIYSPEGVFSHSVGRPGPGPGEFERLSRFAVLDDGAFVVWDPARALVSSFSPTGAFERAWSAVRCIESSLFVIQPTRVCQRPPAGFLSREMLLFDPISPFLPNPPSLGEVHIHDTLSVTLMAVTADSVVPVTSIRRADVIYIGVPPEDYGRLQAIRLFDGEPYYAVRAPWIVYGNSEEPSIRAIRLDTGEERVVVLDREPAAVTSAAMDSVRALHRLREAMLPRDRWNRHFTTFLREAAPRPSQPFYSHLKLDANYRIWVGDYLGSWAGDVIVKSAGTSWTVLGLDGEVVARASFPPSVYQARLDPVLDIRGDKVLLLMIDPVTEVQRVGVFQLRSP